MIFKTVSQKVSRMFTHLHLQFLRRLDRVQRDKTTGFRGGQLEARCTAMAISRYTRPGPAVLWGYGART